MPSPNPVPPNILEDELLPVESFQKCILILSSDIPIPVSVIANSMLTSSSSSSNKRTVIDNFFPLL
jgi:hypothetical protein